MTQTKPTLHVICGKIAAGKSTLANDLGKAPLTITISEDAWLAGLYRDEMTTLQDYVRCTTRLRQVLTPHVVDLLNRNLSVVLDFSANTVEMRKWFREILDQTTADHVLHHLDVPDEVCLQRLKDRNARGDHPFAATEDEFRKMTRHFAAPTPEEGFNVQVHRVS